MSKKEPKIIILGAGPAGVGAAFQLVKKKRGEVTVLEMEDTVGGNSGSFQMEGIFLDYGSHRLHPACHPDILNDIKEMLEDELLIRPRHGRIFLNGKWIHFPLQAKEIVTKLSLKFSLGILSDMVHSFFPVFLNKNQSTKTFASELQANLGKTICREFYFPYAKKIWGLSPDKVSVVQAQKRVSVTSFAKLLKKVFLKVKNNSRDGTRIFYYPKKGYGQITDSFQKYTRENGANFEFNARVKKLVTKNGFVKSVQYVQDGSEKEIEGDLIFSTLPITGLVKGLHPRVDESILSATTQIKFRSMVLIYLFIEENRFTEFDAHYFPGIDIPITRLSEVKNYSDTFKPDQLTAICAELPCNFDDIIWRMSDDDLGNLVKTSLQKAGIPVQVTLKKIITKRLRHAYPIYDIGFEQNYGLLDEYLLKIKNLVSFGRQGLFVHDNTHHALYMAYSAVDCINEDGSFNREKWMKYRHEFESHVVVD